MKCYFCVIVLRRPPCVEVKLPTTRTRNVMSSNSSSILVELYFVSIAYPYSEWKCWVGVIDADVAVVYSKVGRECIKTRDDVSMTKSSGARFSETRFLLGFSVSDFPAEEGIASSAPLLAARLRSFTKKSRRAMGRSKHGTQHERGVRHGRRGHIRPSTVLFK